MSPHLSLTCANAIPAVRSGEFWLDASRFNYPLNHVLLFGYVGTQVWGHKVVLAKYLFYVLNIYLRVAAFSFTRVTTAYRVSGMANRRSAGHNENRIRESCWDQWKIMFFELWMHRMTKQRRPSCNNMSYVLPINTTPQPFH